MRGTWSSLHRGQHGLFLSQSFQALVRGRLGRTDHFSNHPLDSRVDAASIPTLELHVTPYAREGGKPIVCTILK